MKKYADTLKKSVTSVTEKLKKDREAIKVLTDRVKELETEKKDSTAGQPQEKAYDDEMKSLEAKYKARTEDFSAQLRQVVSELKESKISPSEHDARVRCIRDQIMASYEEYKGATAKYRN